MLFGEQGVSYVPVNGLKTTQGKHSMPLDIDHIRAQFPALNQPVEGDTLPVFFDNPAGTQVPQGVIDAVVHYWTHTNANTGGHFSTSQRSDAMVQAVRERIARFLNAFRAEEVVFGQNMTTLLFALSRAIGRTLSAGDEIVVTRMDHEGNISPWLHLAEDHDLVVRWVDVDTRDCTLDMDTLEGVLTDRTRIVATAHASNAVGTINPVQQIGEMAKAAGALYVVDAVQSAPHLSLDVQAIGCDFLLCSAYKFYGPHLGVLWGRYDLMAELPAYKVRPATDIPPDRWETGTPSYETIAGLGAAIDYLASQANGQAVEMPSRPTLVQAMNNLQARERELVTHLIEVLQAVPGVQIAGISDPARFSQRVPTVAFVKAGHSPDEVARYLGHQQLYVWSGDYYAVEIMRRLGHDQQGMVRVGLAHYNTHNEIDRFGAALRTL